MTKSSSFTHKQIAPVFNQATAVLSILMNAIAGFTIVGSIILLIVTVAQTNAICAEILAGISLVAVTLIVNEFQGTYVSTAAEQFQPKLVNNTTRSRKNRRR